jgi:hypothetical protein
MEAAAFKTKLNVEEATERAERLMGNLGLLVCRDVTIGKLFFFGYLQLLFDRFSPPSPFLPTLSSAELQVTPKAARECLEVRRSASA